MSGNKQQGHGGSEGFDPFNAPLISSQAGSDTLKQLIDPEEGAADFMTLTSLEDANEAADVARIAYKMARHNIDPLLLRNLLRAKVSIKQSRALLVVSGITGIMLRDLFQQGQKPKRWFSRKDKDNEEKDK